MCSFDDEHERTNDGDEDEDEEEIDKYLLETHANALEKQITFVDERKEFKHSENTQKSEHTQDEKVACRRKARDEGKIKRQGGHKVNNTKKTEGIVLGTRRTIESKDVLNGEEEGEDILHHSEYIFETSHHSRLRLDERHNEAEDDSNHHGYVERLARLCVRIEHDIIEARLIFKQCEKLFHVAKVRNN